MKLAYRSPILRSFESIGAPPSPSAASTRVRWLSSARWDSTLNAPYSDMSGGICVFFNQPPLANW